MAFIFNNDKTRINMEDAIKRKSYLRTITLEYYDNETRFNLSSDELILKGYKAVGVVGWVISRPDLSVTGAYMHDDETAIVKIYDPTGYSKTIQVEIDILWVKQ